MFFFIKICTLLCISFYSFLAKDSHSVSSLNVYSKDNRVFNIVYRKTEKNESISHELAEQLIKVVASDLIHVHNLSFVSEQKVDSAIKFLLDKNDYTNMLTMGVDYILNIESVSFDQVNGRPNLFVDVFLINSSGAIIFKKSFSLNEKNIRLSAHQLSHAIVLNILDTKSPFLSKMAYIETDKNGAKKGLYFSDWDGVNGKVLVKGDYLITPAYSGKNNILAYVNFSGGVSRIMFLNLKEKNSFPINKYFTQLKDAKTISPAFSKDGRFVVFSVIKYKTVDVLLGDMQKKTTKKIISSSSTSVSHSFSPDGKFLAFTSNRSGPLSIYIMDLKTYDIKPMMPEKCKGFCFEPSWSPDGKKIAFINLFKNKFRLFVFDLESKKLTMHHSNYLNERPQWSCDSSLLLFSSRAESKDIFGSKIMTLNINKKNKSLYNFNEIQYGTNPIWLFD